MGAVSAGTLLGGQVRYEQPVAGHRTGIEPVLLAAAVPAQPGERVLEGGSGAGAGLLCLAARVADLRGIGLEAAPAMAALANRNLAANGFAGCRIDCCDIATAARCGRFDHAFANPPWHDPAGTASPDALRDLAKRAPPTVALTWCRSLAGALRPRGSLTLILPAARLADWIGAVAAAGCGAITLLPLWPRAGQPAKLLILQAVRGSAGPSRLLPGLTLHDEAGYTAAADGVLRQGAPIIL